MFSEFCEQWNAVVGIFFILCRIFLANYSRNFAWLHTGNGYGHFVLVNIANTDLLHRYLPWGRCVVVLDFFAYVVFIFHFLLLALNCAHLGALQY